ncbi:MAG: heme NO-binding protein [Verrucomicrobia bacterium]|nr:MAG: heme NO-binding protein [Verrucomicrobiota bacterium]
MKGIIFNLLQEIVEQEYGEKTWDALLAAAKLEGAYTSLGSYPDADLMKLVAAASAALGQPPDDIVRWVGRKAVPLLAAKYPKFFQPHHSTRSFVLTLNQIIHPEVRKLYPGADVPEFDFGTSSDEVLLMGYQSPRRLCAFAEGLIEGAADHYGERVDFEHLKCMKRGDPKCVFRISFHKDSPT